MRVLIGLVLFVELESVVWLENGYPDERSCKNGIDGDTLSGERSYNRREKK
jgi:hypothetical protein